ncbi:MAG: DEAD/DEAH box helicase family protein [Candidatus Moranbacteria bacterium]|nr:DEAD/DEAH box helicase family protein [Candidatus Moranbacteria bacterium]
MSQNFLYEQLDSVSNMGLLKKDIPDFIVQNLNPKFELREYQKEAFARFFHCYAKPFENKELPLHFLFNMATGSGKTLIMAGLIMHLYKQGYRNFIFFVNSNNIIEKTKDNFLNEASSKYLFNQRVVFQNKEVNIKKVDNFEGVSNEDINICFTTIQKMHTDLLREKENSLTFEDFKDKKIVLLADEAHHGQVQTKQKSLDSVIEKPNWENTVEKIFKQNNKNLLLEFTATMDFLNRDIVEKYKNKIIYRYDLKEFRNDGFSKDVELLSTDFGRKERIVQAIILSQYRQEVAGKNGMSLKPVILFKAQKTIAESAENKELFHNIIEELSIADIDEIRIKSNIEVLKKAFLFFHSNKISDSILVKKLKDNFAVNKCLSVNEDKEKEEFQLLLNSLEDKDNQIRAIFAVQKLNEGWDVLNLFDIVRLYESRDGKDSKPGKTTISEAQLIGRGARYFPFATNKEDDKFTRKYDKDLENELRVLEELHYHSHNESRYISEIKSALKKEGLIDENEIELDLNLKEEFKKTDFYKSGMVWKNELVRENYERIKSLEDLGVHKRNITHEIISGRGIEIGVFAQTHEETKEKREQKDMLLHEIDMHVIKNALSKNDFFEFENLKKYLPKLESVEQFINQHLLDMGVTFLGAKKDINYIDNGNQFLAIINLLNEVEKQIKENIVEYRGTEEFAPHNISKVFTNKKIKVNKESERANGQEDFLSDKPWYVFNANYGTQEEKDFVQFMDRQIEEFQKQFKSVYLIRNERQMKIYNFKDGRAFEPDYVLFLLSNEGEELTYQLFIEPKGAHLIEHDQWKDDFLEEIREKLKGHILEFGESKYKVLGIPFYSSVEENEFKEKMFEALK